MLSSFRKKQKRSIAQYFLLAFGAMALLVLVGLLAVADMRIYSKKRELNAQLASLQSKVQELQVKNNDLKQGISESDNPDYIEKVAREELDLQKPGEKVVSFVEAETKEVAPQASSASFVQVWLGWFEGLFKK